jgi:hypothetical protein
MAQMSVTRKRHNKKNRPVAKSKPMVSKSPVPWGIAPKLHPSSGRIKR